MRFAVLENPPEQNGKPTAPVEQPKPQESAPVTEPEKPKKIPYEHLTGIIDNVGYGLAKDENLTLEEKIAQWVELLRWALPLIPDEHQHFKSVVRESIRNPTEKDFITKGMLTKKDLQKTLPKEKGPE